VIRRLPFNSQLLHFNVTTVGKLLHALALIGLSWYQSNGGVLCGWEVSLQLPSVRSGVALAMSHCVIQISVLLFYCIILISFILIQP